MDISRGNLSMVMVPYRYTLKRIAKGWRSKNVVAMESGFTMFCSVSSYNFFSVIYTFLSLWLLISVTHSCYLKRWNILKKANSLKKGEGFPLLNFEGSPESRVPGSRGPGPTFTPCPSPSASLPSSILFLQKNAEVSNKYTVHLCLPA